MPTLMTGNANTMTIPQLDKVIEKLQIKLKDNNVKNNDTLRSKVESLLFDYTKAKNKILRYYEKTKSKHPELVVGKKNTLTLVQIYKNKGELDKADKLSQKDQKLAYNVADFLKDTKGYAIGIAATAGALGVANAISMGVANKGILTVIGETIKAAFKASPLSASLITAGLAIGGACYLVPKIARSVQRIKNNKTQAREMNNELLQVAGENDLDRSKNVNEIVEILNSNKNLKDMLRDPAQFTAITKEMTPAEVAKLKNAMAQHDAQLNKEERENLAAAGKERYKEMFLDSALADYEVAKNAAPKESIDELNKQLNNIEAELTTTQNRPLKINQQISKLQANNTNLTNENISLASQEAMFTTTLTTKKPTIDNLRNKNIELKNELTTLTATKDRLIDEKTEMKGPKQRKDQEEAIQDTINKINVKQTEYDQNQQEIDKFEQLEADLKNIQDKIKNNENTLNENLSTIAELRNEAATLNPAKEAALKTKIASIKNAISAKENLEDKIKKLKDMGLADEEAINKALQDKQMAGYGKI